MLLVETALHVGGVPGVFQFRRDSLPSLDDKE
jgi:hypothetical protein